MIALLFICILRVDFGVLCAYSLHSSLCWHCLPYDNVIIITNLLSQHSLTLSAFCRTSDYWFLSSHNLKLRVHLLLLFILTLWPVRTWNFSLAWPSSYLCIMIIMIMIMIITMMC